MKARNRELLALVPVAALLAIGFAQVFIVSQGEEGFGELSLTYGAYFLALCLAAHIFLRLRLPHADPYIFPLTALLIAIGLIFVYRIEPTLALEQATVFVIGLIAFVATILLLRDIHVLEQYRYLIAGASILLLLAPRIPGIGAQANGAYLGVVIGPISFQPAELAKIGIVIFLASYLAENREMLSTAARRFLGLTLPPLKYLGPLLVVWGAAMLLLVFIRDLGSSLMFFGAFLIVIYVATNRLSYVLIGLTLFLGGAYFIAGTVPHVQDRFDIWLDPFAAGAPAGAGQIQQSLFAQADGGLFGTGIGRSLLELPGPFAPQNCPDPFPFCGSIVPAPHTDFIFAVIAAEIGLIGACGVIATYVLFAVRGFKTALMAPDGFAKLLATGLTGVFTIQAFVIIGGVTKTIPLTGVTLPFISYGGSSIVANMILVALLLMVSNDARRPARDRDPIAAAGGEQTP